MQQNRFILLVLSAILCLASLSAQSQCTLVGWASQNGGVTGGGTAAATVVTNYNDLKAAITSSTVKVVHISGTITIPSGGRISFQDQSGKTIYGLPGARLVSSDLTQDGSGILSVKRVSNIIFRNIIFEGPGAYDADGWDNVTIDASINVWVDHCEFQDGMDGNLDIKNATDYVTVTWCKFVYNKTPIPGGSGGSDDHRFSNLFGSSDGATGDRGKLRITMQYCWWGQGCKARMPRVRFGKVHVVNNLFNSSVAAQCVMAGFEADLLVESNVFENVTEPIDLMDNTFTAITARNNIFTNTSGNTAGSGTAFTPPYSLTVTPASQVKNLVTASAGATLTSPSCGGTNPNPTTYTLSTTAVPTAGGNVTGAGTYNSGTAVTVTATPAAGYIFTGWSGDASGTATSVSVTLNGNKSVTANFTLQNNGGSNTIRIEDNATTAQGFCAYEGSISNNSGANNGKVINLTNSAGRGMTWRVSVPSAGVYTLTWRYVNSSSSNSYVMALIVNGTTVNSAQPFPRTSSSTVFANATATVSLAAGSNAIRLQSVASSATADIDWIEITGNAPSTANCAGLAATGSTVSLLLGNDVTEQQVASIYPNPTSGSATINVTLAKNEQAAIRLYDAQGRMVDDLGIVRSVAGGVQKIVCNLSNRKPGLYYVTIISSKGLKSSYKLVVE
jgi:pectate lyase